MPDPHNQGYDDDDGGHAGDAVSDGLRAMLSEELDGETDVLGKLVLLQLFTGNSIHENLKETLILARLVARGVWLADPHADAPEESTGHAPQATRRAVGFSGKTANGRCLVVEDLKHRVQLGDLQ